MPSFYIVTEAFKSILLTFFSRQAGKQANYANMADLTQILSLRTEKQKKEKAVLRLSMQYFSGTTVLFPYHIQYLFHVHI